MFVQVSQTTTSVLHPSGRPIKPSDLPSETTRRWTALRKAELVACVRAGLISLEQVYQRYMLSEEELLSWDNQFEKHGVSGLRTTRLKQYRKRAEVVSDNGV